MGRNLRGGPAGAGSRSGGHVALPAAQTARAIAFRKREFLPGAVIIKATARKKYPGEGVAPSFCGRNALSYRYFLAFFFAAQYAFIRAACSLRYAAVNRRFFRVFVGTTTAFLAGRPRRFVRLPPRASIARLSLSRSSTSSAIMCSVGISEDRSTMGYRMPKELGPVITACYSCGLLPRHGR